MIIVADANELFAALIARGITLDVFFNPNIECVAPEFILKEFEKHRDEIVSKSGLEEEELDSFFFLLSEKIRLFDEEDYKDFLTEAREISPDHEDVDYFALALKLNCPIWTREKGLKKQDKVKILSTTELMKII